MFILETERLKLIPFDDYTFPFYRVLKKVGMQKYEENEKMFWWKLTKI